MYTMPPGVRPHGHRLFRFLPFRLMVMSYHIRAASHTFIRFRRCNAGGSILAIITFPNPVHPGHLVKFLFIAVSAARNAGSQQFVHSPPREKCPFASLSDLRPTATGRHRAAAECRRRAGAGNRAALSRRNWTESQSWMFGCRLPSGCKHPNSRQDGG